MLFHRRVPVVLQLNSVECGAACLSMVLGYHGRHTSLADCRDHCTPGRDGVTARTIATAARSFGLNVKAFSSPNLTASFALPAIVHWRSDHFVVVERLSAQGVDIVDPDSGRRQLTHAEFAEGFTGVVLTMTPGPQFTKRRATSTPLWRQFLGVLWRVPGTPWALTQILIASLLLQLLALGLPLVTQSLIDTVLPSGVTNLLAIIGLAMVILVLAQVVTGYLRSALMVSLQARLDTQLMLGFFARLLSLPFRFFQQRTTGDLLMRLASNTQIRSTLTSQTLSVFLDGGLVVANLIILFWHDALFGALGLGIGVVQVGLLLAALRRSAALMQQHLAAEAASQAYLVEALTGITTLKSTGSEGRALDRWSALFFTELNLTTRLGQLEALIETAMLGLRTAAPLLLLWVGAWRVLDGSMSLGTMLALNALALGFLAPLTALTANWQRLQLVGAYLERIADVLHARPEQDTTQVQQTPPLSGRIEVRDVSFRYDSNSPWVLRNVSLTIEPGQKLALVGHSGCGKSTLAKLLLGLLTPTEGSIVYFPADGTHNELPLDKLNLQSLRRQFGVVLQESFLFSGSIHQNIAFQNPELSLDAVAVAARLAAIDEDVAAMPMGYLTRIAEGGTGLSGGQRQRLSIARALASKPTVLLLDEATSHLDATTERKVDDNLSALDTTRIVIAHRLSTIRNADTILVLDEGEIVERGTHEELLARNEVYAGLVSSDAH